MTPETSDEHVVACPHCGAKATCEAPVAAGGGDSLSVDRQDCCKTAAHSAEPVGYAQANPTRDVKQCPFCGEQILAIANKCKHCGEFLNGPVSTTGKIKRTEFLGVGALVQILGVIALFFFPIGTVAGIMMIIIGYNMSRNWYCRSCGNRLEHEDVLLCPACHSRTI